MMTLKETQNCFMAYVRRKWQGQDTLCFCCFLKCQHTIYGTTCFELINTMKGPNMGKIKLNWIKFCLKIPSRILLYTVNYHLILYVKRVQNSLKMSNRVSSKPAIFLCTSNAGTTSNQLSFLCTSLMSSLVTFQRNLAINIIYTL